MRLLAGRLTSTRRAVACSMVFVAAACSSDAPGVVSPAAVNPSAPDGPLAVLDLSNGPVTAEIRSTWLQSQCVSVRNATMANNTRAELQPCTDAPTQKFQFASTNEIKVGSTNYCLDVYDGNRGAGGDPVVIFGCDGTGSQKWSLTSAGEIKGVNSGLCVSFKGHPDNGTALYLTSCSGTDAEKWTTVPVSSPTPSPVAVASVSVLPAQASLSVGQTVQATATEKDASGNVLTGRLVTWTSSAPSVASVSAAGLVTALAAGAANIVATSEGKTGSAAITVATVTSSPPASSCSLVTDLVARSEQPLAKPGYLQAATDPAFGTTLVRVSGDPGAAIGGGLSGVWPQVAGSSYAKRQAWSADGAFLMLDVAGAVGGGVSLLLDGASYQVVGKAGPAPSYVWHPTQPDVLIGVTGSGSVVNYNVRTKATTTRAAVSGYTGGWLGKGEGNPSNDGRYVPVSAKRADGREVVFVVDAVAGTKSADLDVTAEGFSALDWVGVSQSGRYLFLFGTLEGVWGRSKVYDRATLALVHYWSDHPTGHADLGLDAAGNDVLFGGAAGGPYVKRFIARRLDNGQVTPLTGPISYNWHASTRNTARPGWGYVVTNDAAGTVFDRSVYAVALDGSGRVERLAHHRSNITDYEANPFAVPAPDGRRVLMRSDWGAGSGRPTQGFVVDARRLCN